MRTCSANVPEAWKIIGNKSTAKTEATVQWPTSGNELVRYYFKIVNKHFLKIVLLVIVALLCCGCDKAPLDPQIPYGLLIKCRDFLAFCIFLADQEKPYYNHIAQRYYYAMLSLATITYQWHKGHGVEYRVVKHEEVWKTMPHDVKKTYGEDLKGLRTQCDYHYEQSARDLEVYRKGLSFILGEKDKAFSQLDNKVRIDYTKFFGEKVTDKTIKSSDLDSLMEEINDLHTDLAKRLS